MPWRWQEPTKQVLLDGRVADVKNVYFGDAGSWKTVSNLYAPAFIDDGTDPGGGDGGGEDPDPGNLPPAPAGYKSWYEVDFRNIGTRLPAGWVAQNSGPANAGASYRPQNVAVVPGKGLVHTAERAAVGQPAYTGKVYARIGVPQFCHVRFRAYVTGLKNGVWPSFWQRPQSGGSGEGEKDLLEIFGGHMPPLSAGPRVFGANWITTPYGPVSQNTLDFDSTVGVPSNNALNAAMEAPHVYESRQVPTTSATPGNAQFWVDDKKVPGQIAASTSSTAEGRNQWLNQFENPAARWYFRTDLQISGNRAMTGGSANAGDSNAGPLSADQVGKFAFWTIEYVQVFVPTSYTGPEPTV